MTEKQYSGNSPHGVKSQPITSGPIVSAKVLEKKRIEYSDEEFDNSELTKEAIENSKKAGAICVETIKYAKSFIKPGMPLLEIAEKIEDKIIQLGGKPAFPVNLSINEVAAHSTPSFNDTTKASGLLKVDLGAHISGFIADTSFSIDLENSEENKKLIATAQKALDEACKIAKLNTPIREVGKIIEKTIKNSGFQPIQNLCGHSITQYDLHAGITLPNIDNAQEKPLDKGVYAIEPFVTTGLGKVKDGRPSGIYALTKQGNVRDAFARQVLEYIEEEYQTLPFCLRWLQKKFGSRAAIAMQRIDEAGLVHHYAQLIEAGNGKVAQAENTLIITEKETIVTTR